MYEVWVADIGTQPIAAASKILSEEEQDRASRFHLPMDRARFVVVHALKRLCLAHKVGRSEPRSLNFATLSFGKPILIGEKPRYHFSLSHSGNRCAIAVSVKGRCGVDIEVLDRSSELPSALHRAMTVRERQALTWTGHPQNEFMQRWVLKEAYAKWLGLGLHLEFQSLCTEYIHWIDRAFGLFEGTPCWRMTDGSFAIAACGKGLDARRISRQDKDWQLPGDRFLYSHCYQFSQ